jgi:hypothetical protein
MKAVLVRGDGVAAYCCAHLLAKGGVPVAQDRPSRPRLPAIMLSEAAIELIADVFEQKDLFRRLPRIRSRTVVWGSGAETVVLPHSAVVVSEDTLLDHLRPDAVGEELAVRPEARVLASGPLPSAPEEKRFGSRIAHASPVQLRKSEGPGCWVESTDLGWLFLIGNEQANGWLLSVGVGTSANLERSRLVARQIVSVGASGGEFQASPRIVVPLCGSVEGSPWLACGTAALAFDPLCGDGTAHAVREAVLAAAAIRAIFGGARPDEVLAHYESRLTAGFKRHLINCAGFYRTGGNSPWWSEQVRALELGLDWCADRMAQFPAFRYRLNGYELEAVTASHARS